MRKSPISLTIILRKPAWFVLVVLVIILPVSTINAQEEDYEDPTEVFWGDDEEEGYEDEEYLEDDEYFEEDTLDEYYDEDEFYDEDTSDYYEDDEFYDEDEEGLSEEDEESLSDTELADMAKRMGFSMNISGSSPGFVNHTLNTYNNSPPVAFRLSVEFPMLLQVAGVRFRLGAEVGNFGFENYMPVGGKFSGITAMGLLAFPAGPGKIKIGLGLVGNTFGVTAESTYGFAVGNTLEIRAGIRSTTAMGVIDTKDNDLGITSWVDGLIMLGFNL